MFTNIRDLQRLYRDKTSVETPWELVVAQLIKVIKNQQTTIKEQRRKIHDLPDVSLFSVNTTNDLSKRVLDIEKKWRKQRLIFDWIEFGRDERLTTALSLPKIICEKTLLGSI